MAQTKKDAITHIFNSKDEGFVTLNCITKTTPITHIKVCRRFLSAYSDQLRQTISNELKTPQSSINCEIKDVNLQHWEQFIRYCYGDDLEFSNQNILPLLAISIKLIVPALKQECIDDIAENIHVKYNSISIFEALHKFGFVNEALTIMCKINQPPTALIRAFFNSKLAICFNTEQIVKLFNQTKIIDLVEPETIWEYIIQWHDKTNTNVFVNQLKKYINFTKMEIEYFNQNVDPTPHLTIQEKYTIWKHLCLATLKHSHDTQPTKKRNRSE